MRLCGACLYRDSDKRLPPSAACVVAFARTMWDGPEGILAHVRDLAERGVVASASSYCTACRSTTWLCGADKNISEATLDFWHHWHRSTAILLSMQQMTALVRKRKRGHASAVTVQGLEEVAEDPCGG